jgi:Gram-negative bacterial TonB protein C-terminal
VMMQYLKRILPFTLTFLIGAGLGGFAGLFKSRLVSRSEFVLQGSGVGRGHRYRGCKQSTPVIHTYEPNTRYTKEAWEKKVTGTVRLRVTFGADGEIKDVVPVLGLPYGLTEEAAKVAWRAKFIPATERGRPVTVSKDLDYVFSLNDRMAAGL